jgi:hypothetical protein
VSCGRQIVARLTVAGVAATNIQCRATVGCEGTMVFDQSSRNGVDRPHTHEWFRPEMAADMPARIVDHIKRELRGKDLACWCKPGDRCHADALLWYANE